MATRNRIPRLGALGLVFIVAGCARGATLDDGLPSVPAPITPPLSAEQTPPPPPSCPQGTVGVVYFTVRRGDWSRWLARWTPGSAFELVHRLTRCDAGSFEALAIDEHRQAWLGVWGEGISIHPIDLGDGACGQGINPIDGPPPSGEGALAFATSPDGQSEATYTVAHDFPTGLHVARFLSATSQETIAHVPDGAFSARLTNAADGRLLLVWADACGGDGCDIEAAELDPATGELGSPLTLMTAQQQDALGVINFDYIPGYWDGRMWLAYPKGDWPTSDIFEIEATTGALLATTTVDFEIDAMVHVCEGSSVEPPK